MGKKKNRKQTPEQQDDNISEEEIEVNVQDYNNSELETQQNSQEKLDLNTDIKEVNDTQKDLKEENEFLKQENIRLEGELITLKKELEEQKLRIEGLTKLELLLKIKENLKNKNVEIVLEKNKLEEENKLDVNSTEKILVENKNKVETRKPQQRKLNPFFRRY